MRLDGTKEVPVSIYRADHDTDRIPKGRPAMPETNPPPEPKTIAPQADFPVEWESPDEQKIPWQLDKMHFPEAMPPLESEFWIRFMHGMHLGMEHYEMPMQVAGKEFNYWVYLAIFPRVPPEQMEERGKQSDQNIMDTVHRLRQRWDDEWLPDIQRHIERWDAFDVASASTAELQAHFEEMWKEAMRLFDIHFQIVIPVYVALGLFDDLHHDLFSDDGVFESQKLLQGFDNKTLEVNRGLWDLSRKARASDAVRAIFEERAASDVVEALADYTRAVPADDWTGRAIRSRYRCGHSVGTPERSGRGGNRPGTGARWDPHRPARVGVARAVGLGVGDLLHQPLSRQHHRNERPAHALQCRRRNGRIHARAVHGSNWRSRSDCCQPLDPAPPLS
jgi:hypothetical protein